MLNSYKNNLNTFMFLAIVAGVGFGALFPHQAVSTALVGELFIRLLSLLIVPVIILSMLSGVLNLDDSGSLARIGTKTLLYYASTTALAVIVGLTLVNVIQPGTEDPSMRSSVLEIVGKTASKNDTPPSGSISDVIRNIIPKNIFHAAVNGNVLGLIFFSVFLGVALLSIEHAGVPGIKNSVAALFEGVIWMIERVMLLAPLGFFALIGSLVGQFVVEKRLEQLGASIGWYSLTVVLGLLVHGLIVLPAIARLFGVNPFSFAKAMFPAVTTAFSTASSAATLPVTLDALEHRANIPNRIGSFVAPLGATVNMDGTAIYEAVAVVFIANMVGMDLTASQQLMIFLTATFSAIGAAGIPGAGLIMMVLVLNSVGLPPDGVKLVVVVDRVLDMLRTSINVWGDSIGAAIVAATEQRKD